MDITAYIRELLFGHDCVILPGFGGFIGNYTPAQIDKSTGTFSPPLKQISFNRNLNHNDGLLIGKISGDRGVSYGDARNIVEEFVAGIRKKLDNGEKIAFDNIGSFINNHEGNIQFEPDTSVNYHLDSYGLESFQCMPLEGYDVRKSITRHINPDPARQAQRRKILWRAAIIIPLLSVVLAVPLKTDLFKSRVQTSDLNPLVTKEFEHNREAVDENTPTTLVPSENNGATAAGDASSVNPSEPAPAEVIKTAISPRFFIITGSFQSRENADAQVNMLKAEGFTPEIIPAPNGFYRVCAMSCTDMKTAIHRKDSIAGKFPGTWISRKK